MRDDALGTGASMRLLALLATTLAIAVLLAACGNEGSGSEGKTDTPQGAKTEERMPTEGTTSPKIAAKTAPHGPLPKKESTEDKASSTSSSLDEVQNRIEKEMEEEQRQQDIGVTIAVCKQEILRNPYPEVVEQWNAASEAGDKEKMLRICDAAKAARRHVDGR